MVNLLLKAQKVLVLSDALYCVAKSEDIVNANEYIRRNTTATKRSNGGIALARDLLSCRHAIESSAKSLLEVSNLELQKLACYSSENVQEQISEEALLKNEARVLLETREYSIDVRNDLIRKNVLVKNGDMGGTLNLEELSHDEQAREALDGLSGMIANLNMIYGLAEQINCILDEIKKVKTGKSLQRYLLKYVQDIICTISRTYHNMCERLNQTSKYSFREEVIWSFCEAGYCGKDLMELLDFDIYAKSCIAFEKMPSYILFTRLDGSTRFFS